MGNGKRAEIATCENSNCTTTSTLKGSAEKPAARAATQRMAGTGVPKRVTRARPSSGSGTTPPRAAAHSARAEVASCGTRLLMLESMAAASV